MNIVQKKKSSGSNFPIPRRENTCPEYIDYNIFYNKFSIIGNEINMDPRFEFKRKSNMYIIEYKLNGNNLNYGKNNGSNGHLTLHTDIGKRNKFHVRSNNKNTGVDLRFDIIKIGEVNPYYQLAIEKKNDGTLYNIENDLLTKIEIAFENNYQSFLQDQYNSSCNNNRNSRYHNRNRYNNPNRGYNRNNKNGGGNTKDTNIEEETYKQKYLKYKKKYLDLKKLKFGGNNMNETSF